MTLAAQLQSAIFKSVDGGYLYETPSPWLLGPSRRYIVDEAQKAELLAIASDPRRGRRIAFYIAAIIAWTVLVAGVWSLYATHPQPTALDLLGIAVLTLVPLYIAAVVLLRRHLRRLEPVLRSAVATHARFGRWDRWRATVDALPFRTLLLIFVLVACGAAAQIGSLVMRNERYPLFSDATSWLQLFGAAMMTLLAVMYLLGLIRKRRSASPRR